ncbi:iron uptake porin [cf. Phormidesmis sp. LEGE 11477]|uniref:iron uptake porin n=1 Tax=cf. Phormidesmis sp. LEGE 11477 TaxID=1828680 RepID=UPI0018803F06|nr:iron uptake porin [cf. Phormidesmis sp. LEGE 11477]MBE9060600.1 carbohydrate porin [cf. Phormidesmis sp. LEGE 11477]
MLAITASAGLLSSPALASSGMVETKPTETVIEQMAASPTSLSDPRLESAYLIRSENSADDITPTAPLQSAPPIAAVTVEELSDVSPSDWAYLALKRLVEDYGCVTGYPDSTFRGDRTITRYEFAALLQDCLSFITEMTGLSAGDLATVQRLRDSFNQELADLENRVTQLETDVADLAENQFSVTTRLRGEAVFSLEQTLGDEKADGSGGDLSSDLNFGSRIRLNFDTSFTGQDLLKIRLDQLEPVRLNAPVTGTNMTRLSFDRPTSAGVDIGKLFYRFPVGDRLSLQIDATRGAYQANLSDTFNPGFANPTSGAVTRFGRFNPIYYQGALGTGITGIYDFNDKLALSAGYLARGGASDPSIGLFGGGYTALTQLDYRPVERVRLGLLYARSFYPAGEVAVTAGTGSRLANAPFGGNTATAANHIGVQTSVGLGDRATLSGWAGLSLASALADNGAASDGDNATLFNWAVTLGLPNLGGRGNFSGLLVGQPYRVLNNDGGPDEDDAAWHLEGFYRYQLSPNISLIPGVVVLLNPENNNDNDTIFLGSFRTVFRF